jgi:succinate dehydrogenase / fumarate reductase, cytochrome b subunit
MSADRRPLSPHLQVYRLPLTAWLSVGHRAAGAALGLVAAVFALLLAAAAMGKEPYDAIHGLITSLPGQIVLWLAIYALYFHLCNGVRHLIWDAGYALDLKSVDRGVAAVLILSVVLTVATFVVSALAGGVP